jgi:hypothetical protein
MTTMRIAGLVAVLASAAVGLAGPASAEPLSGDYTGTVTDGGGHYREGKTATWTFTPCGPDCSRLGAPTAPEPLELHVQGNTWTGSHSNGCTTAIDINSLVMTRECGKARVVWQLAKNG